MSLIEIVLRNISELSEILGLHNVVIALYFGIGVFLNQLFHTVHAEKTYFQKQVRGLEWISWFSRDEPKHPSQIKLSWWPVNSHEDEQRGLSRFTDDDLNEEAFWPSQLPEIQLQKESIPKRWRPLFEHFGLQATNLYYCYIMAVFYGVVSFLVIYFLVPSLSPMTIPRLTLFGIFFGLLHVFSFLLVGSSVALTLLEGNIAFNTLVLVALRSSLLSYGDAVSVLQFGAALTIGPLVFWLHFQYDEGHIKYGNFLTIYYIIVPILYSEFFVLLLGLNVVN